MAILSWHPAQILCESDQGSQPAGGWAATCGRGRMSQQRLSQTSQSLVDSAAQHTCVSERREKSEEPSNPAQPSLLTDRVMG